jgi:hypothetical protein
MTTAERVILDRMAATLDRMAATLDALLASLTEAVTAS